jgi:2-methylcitrate dehydratase PrpD
LASDASSAPRRTEERKIPNLTAKLARHIVGYRSADLDRAALTVAKQCVLDWYGVTLAGSSEPVARILREEVASSSQGPASIVGFNLRCSPADAALINGATSMRSTTTTFIR